VKRPNKRIDLLEAEKKGDFPHAEIGARKEPSRRAMTDIIKNVLVSSTQFAESALKGAHTHT
jgi:hypothetical protein